MAERKEQAAAVEAVEEAMLGGRRRWTRTEVAEQAGVDLDVARSLWRALGFPVVPDDARHFTDGDVEALRAVRRLQDLGVLEDGTVVRVARALGQQLARMADWQIALVGERLVGESGALAADDVAAVARAAGEQVLPPVQQLMLHVWRRQLAASGTRTLSAALGDTDSSRMTVCFADLVSYTKLSRSIDQDELGDLLDSFEGWAADRIAESGGRLVKTLGDEVLFVCDDPCEAADVVLDLLDRHAADDDLPDLRAGLATGETLMRLGDVYGSTVNLASRLTGEANKGTALCDAATAEALAAASGEGSGESRRRSGEGDGPRWLTKPARSVRLRGFRHVDAYVLRRG